MQILIAGCGAMGGVLAATLTGVAQVTIYDTDAAHVAAIRENGLQLSGEADRTVHLPADSEARALAGRPFDTVVFLTKSKDTQAALDALRPVLGGDELLVTFQNGMGNAEVLLAGSAAPVARGAMMNAAKYLGPGRVSYLRAGTTWLGPVRGTLDRVAPLADAMEKAGMAVDLMADPMPAVWSKFVFNAVMNPVGALVMGDNAVRYDSPDIVALIDDMAAECEAVVRALGVRLAYDPLDYVKKTRRGDLPVSKHGGSMALDIARGAPTEIEELTGFIVREGDRLGVPVSVCRTITRLVKGLEMAAAKHAA